MFCRKCGKTIPDDSAFCSYCGGKTIHGDESMPIDIPAEKEHGYCSNCGEPLPSGKLTGLCNACFEQIGYDPCKYGKCEECGGPLDSDDAFICKKCISKDNEEKKGFYTPYSIMPDGNYSGKYSGSNKHIKRKRSFLAGTLICIGILFTIEIVSSIARSISVSTSPTSSTAEKGFTGFSSSATESQQATSTEKADLELISYDGTFDTSINAIHITGEVKNNTGKTYSYVQIHFVLYDKSGSQVGTALANTNGLEPGNTWKYDAIGMAKNVSSFKATDLFGY